MTPVAAHRDIWQQCKNRSQSGHARHGRTCCRLDPVASFSGPSTTSGLPHLTSLARRADWSPPGPRNARPDDRLRRNPPLADNDGFASNPPLGYGLRAVTNYAAVFGIRSSWPRQKPPAQAPRPLRSTRSTAQPSGHSQLSASLEEADMKLAEQILDDRFHETNRFKLPGPHPRATASPLSREEAGEA
jgi:hypothetical protein